MLTFKGCSRDFIPHVRAVVGLEGCGVIVTYGKNMVSSEEAVIFDAWPTKDLPASVAAFTGEGLLQRLKKEKGKPGHITGLAYHPTSTVAEAQKIAIALAPPEIGLQDLTKMAVDLAQRELESMRADRRRNQKLRNASLKLGLAVLKKELDAWISGHNRR
jgi:hypothetical protein